MSKKACALIVVDPTAKKHPAVQRGMLIAKALDLRVDLFICDYNANLVGGSFLDSGKLKRAKSGYLKTKKKFLEKLAKPYQQDGIDVTVKVAWDRPLYEGIIRQSLHSNARFVFKDTHYHSVLSKVLFTNTDWQLIRSCPAPLWLVRSAVAFVAPVVLAAVDPLHENDKPASLDDRILSEAFAIADALNGPVHVAHAYNAFQNPENPDDVEAEHAAAMGLITEKFQVPDERAHLHAGNATDLLPKIAEDIGASLTIMGAVSRSRIKNAVIGSTAENVLDSLSSDVLVIKPKGFISPVTFKPGPNGVVYAD